MGTARKLEPPPKRAQVPPAGLTRQQRADYRYAVAKGVEAEWRPLHDHEAQLSPPRPPKPTKKQRQKARKRRRQAGSKHAEQRRNRRAEAYNRYINSDQWADKRRDYFAVNPRRCASCAATRRLHVHHKTYKRFRRELLTDLVALCVDCHEQLHHEHRQHKIHDGVAPDLYAFTEQWILTRTGPAD